MKEVDFKSLYENIKEYDEYRNNPAKREEYNVWMRWKVDKMLSVLPDGMFFETIAEIGCAFGEVLSAMDERLKPNKSVGVDISENNIKLAKSLHPNIVFLTGTIEDINIVELAMIEGHRFNLVVLCDIVEHIPNDLDFLRKIKEIAEYVVIDLPLEKSISTRNRNYGPNDISGHLRSYNLKDGINLLTQAGFQVLNFKTEIVYDENNCRKIWKDQTMKRLNLKSPLKKYFWKLFYILVDVVRKLFPSLYTKYYGCNLFAFIK